MSARALRALAQRAPPASRGARAGLTLVELLIVMALLAVLMGLGLGLLTRLDLSDRAAVTQVQAVLRAGQNWAVARRATARVVLDAQHGRLRAEGLQVVGTWRFEQLPLTGALGIESTQLGGELIEDGFHGRALSFAGQPPRSRVEFHVQSDPAWDPSSGFSIACAVRPAGAAGGALLEMGGAAGLETLEGGALRLWITVVAHDPEEGPRRGGRVPLTTPPGFLVPGRWSTVEARYDRRRLTLRVDGALAAEVAETAPVWRIEDSLVLSPAPQPFPGAIDDLVVACVAASEELELPLTARLAPGTLGEIVFAAGGGLDRGVHAEPVRLRLLFDDGRSEELVVELFGTVQ